MSQHILFHENQESQHEAGAPRSFVTSTCEFNLQKNQAKVFAYARLTTYQFLDSEIYNSHFPILQNNRCSTRYTTALSTSSFLFIAVCWEEGAAYWMMDVITLRCRDFRCFLLWEWWFCGDVLLKLVPCCAGCNLLLFRLHLILFTLHYFRH